MAFQSLSPAMRPRGGGLRPWIAASVVGHGLALLLAVVAVGRGAAPVVAAGSESAVEVVSDAAAMPVAEAVPAPEAEAVVPPAPVEAAVPAADVPAVPAPHIPAVPAPVATAAPRPAPTAVPRRPPAHPALPRAPEVAAAAAAATPDPPGPAPAKPGAEALASAAASDWKGEVVAWLRGHMRYPEDARQRGIAGDVGVRFTMDRAGHVLDVAITRGSGSELLDAAALALLRGATLPPAPDPANPVPVTMGVTFHYHMEREGSGTAQR